MVVNMDAEAKTNSITESTASKGSVLVVDDDPLQLRAIERILVSRGYDVECVTDGRDASVKLASGKWDTVLSDVAMPGMNGIELLRSVRERQLDVPVVLITGQPAIETAMKALELGAFHYLTKPVDLTALEDVVARAVRLRRMAAMKREAAELLGGAVQTDDTWRLAASFDRAMESLWAAYQPIVSLKEKKIYGYEALLRSGEPSLPHPGAVLDAAERLGRIEILGRTMRSRAAEPVAANPSIESLFVNLHPADLLDPDLLSPTSPLSRIANRVVLEITERASLDKVTDLRSRVASLREMGFRIAVDDLGAGYAGLTSFALLEPEIVKLDMTLVRDIHKSSTKQKLVRSMSELCKDMGMMVISEGVETAEERDLLVSLGCDLLQGYFFAKPGKPFPEVAL
jgi:EAL domain-containing protein (putative c-di-GMP-specific phosphodiesterase class I)/CheY-like chemotaxis protein